MESQSLSQTVPVVTGDRIQGSPESLEKRRSGGGPHEPFTRPEVPGLLVPTVGRSIEDVRIEDIQSINRIPDPINPTSAERPYLAKSGKGYFCLDGSDKIAAAKAKSGSSAVVSCAVDTLAEHDDDDLIVRKAIIRSATRGGKAEYMELCRNAVFLLSWLTSSNPNLKINSHGGRRTGAGFNKEDNAYRVLSNLLCKSETTIEGYVDHAKYLTEAAIRFYIANRVKKEFFDNMRVEKRNLIASLIEEKRPEEEIAAEVSTMMITRFTETLNKTKKTKEGNQAAEKKQSAVKTEKSGARTAKGKGQDAFDAKSENPAPDYPSTDTANDNNTARSPEPNPGTQAQTINNSDLEDGVIRDEDPDSPFTVEDIKSAALGVSMRLEAHMKADLPLEGLKSCFEREIDNLVDLLRKTESLLAAR